VRVEHDGSEVARLLARRLVRSPRFRADPAGFRVVLRARKGELHFQMFRLNNVRHVEGAVPLEGTSRCSG
jgi:hypothetical protein